MDVNEFRSNRWIKISLGDGDPLKESILEVARDHEVGHGWLQVIGEVKDGRIVSGYRGPDSDEKIVLDRSENEHVIALGTVKNEDGVEEVHLHGPMGREGQTGTGCWAGEQSVFKGLDVLLVELEPV